MTGSVVPGSAKLPVLAPSSSPASLEPPRAPHLSLFAGLEGEMLQQGGDGHFHNQQSKSHPDAVPGTSPKGQVRVWVYGLLVLLAEPGW